MTNLFMKKLNQKITKLFRSFIPIFLIGVILSVNIYTPANVAWALSFLHRLRSVTVLAYDNLNSNSIVPTPTVMAKQEEITDTRTWTKFKYKDLIAETSQKYDLDPQLIYATIMTESEGNEYAYRYEPHLDEPSLCMGQILISTARSLGFRDDPVDMFEPATCIDLIGKYHRNMLDTYQNLSPQQLARAYNTGSPWKRPVYGHLSRFNMWYNEKS